MGNCCGTEEDGEKGERSRSTDHTSLHQAILRERKFDVYKKYEEKEVLGQGSMGHVARIQVREGTEGGSAFNPEKKNGHKLITAKTGSSLSERRQVKVDYALKSIQLDRVSPQFVTELRNEIDILKGMDHPNIVKAHEVYTYQKQIYIILELCDGGDLYTHLPYSEKRAAGITGKLMSAVKYMHDHGIVHRDLKFENIMFENKSDNAEVKVIDFGLSKKFLNNHIGIMHEGVGTLYSMSPQVLQGVYTSQADLWSCGVITYMLLSSHRPFYHKRRKVMIDRIMRCDYAFGKDYWKPISDEAKDFINNLLVLDPRKRMDAGKALHHVWLSKEFSLSDRVPDQTTADAVQENLIHYKDISQLKKIALNASFGTVDGMTGTKCRTGMLISSLLFSLYQVIAHKSSTDEILQLRKVFDQFDYSNDGTISLEEFQSAMKKMNYPPKEMESIFKSIDVNKNGHIQYTEFIAATLEAQGHIEEERVAEAFDRLDSDDSGFISRQNLREFLGKEGTNEKINNIMKEGDADNDGKISYDEFLALFRKQTMFLLDSVAGIHESSRSGDDNLVGLDTNIPGGKYDSSVQAKTKK